MKQEQTEAQRLADALERMVRSTPWDERAAVELRRLSASDQAQRNALAAIYQALGTSNPDMTAWPAEIRELRSDAERYRWLRDPIPARNEVFLSSYVRESFDAAIDAAMKEKKT